MGEEIGSTAADRFRSFPSVPAVTAWAFAAVGTLLPSVVAREFLGGEPSWLLPAQVVSILGLLGGTVVVERLRHLRVFALVLLVARAQFVVDWHAINEVLGTAITGGFWAWAADRTVSFLLAVLLLVALLAVGYGRDDLLLRRGSLTATFEPVSLPGLSEPRPWRWYGLRWGGGIVLVTIVVTAAQGGRLWILDLAPRQLVVAVPIVLLMAAFNAFNEEFVFRGAPLTELTEVLGKHHALVLMGYVFGISHYYGTPSGVPALAMGVFLGWFLGKSMLETGGIGYAWGLHVLLDVVVFTSF
jgi:membrane protease YdiL (CAAX protease family)